MSLQTGARLGVYEVTALLGAGGMGEVYRAWDTTLGREVAIKVLPTALAQDADRLARFEREAKTLAGLSHPNIAIVHGLEREHGTCALVMELVDGQTLAERLTMGAIALDEALPIARQIAKALEEAERHGIVTFCITVDPAGHDYLRVMCPGERYAVIDDVAALPEELPKLYRALDARRAGGRPTRAGLGSGHAGHRGASAEPGDDDE